MSKVVCPVQRGGKLDITMGWSPRIANKMDYVLYKDIEGPLYTEISRLVGHVLDSFKGVKMHVDVDYKYWEAVIEIDELGRVNRLESAYEIEFDIVVTLNDQSMKIHYKPQEKTITLRTMHSKAFFGLYNRVEQIKKDVREAALFLGASAS